MSFLNSLDLSASGMTAEQLRMDVISNNLANVDTTQSPGGGPFRRKEVILSPNQPSFMQTLRDAQQGDDSGADTESLAGVRATGIVDDPSPLHQTYDPGNPAADKKGYVSTPNINVVTEMVDMMGATRAYEADVTAVNSAKSMAEHALDIGKA